MPLVCVANDTSKTESEHTQRNKRAQLFERGFGYGETTIISADIDNGNSYKKNKYIACEAEGAYFRAYNYLYLSSPFFCKEMQLRCFFHLIICVETGYAESEFPDGALFAETVAKSPVWNIDSDEELNLDYHIYLLPLFNGQNIDEQLEMPSEKVLKTELVFFSPYFEKDGSSYVLTWNPEELVPDSATLKDGMLFFPFRDEPGTHLGAVFSPVLIHYLTLSKKLLMYGKVGNSTIRGTLTLTGKDNDGKTWVLSWKKVKREELLNFEQNTTHP